jgi:hypothetical protein
VKKRYNLEVQLLAAVEVDAESEEEAVEIFYRNWPDTIGDYVYEFEITNAYEVSEEVSSFL